MRDFSNIAKFMKDARESIKLPQVKLGRLIGVNEQYISNWERGICAPPVHKLQKIMTVLKIEPEKLIEAMLEDELRVIIEKVYPEGIRDQTTDEKDAEKVFVNLYGRT